jgi:thiol-disulfide isomerase/thioredoxin
MLTAIVRPTRRSILLSSLALMCTGPAALADVAFDLRSYKGKVVVVDFWASWCVPCRRSFPWLNDMYDRYAGDGLVILAVNLDEDRGAADRFLQDYPPRFTVIFGEGEALAKDFDVVAMPSSYLVGRDGKILHRHLGFLVKQQDEYEAAIAEALGDKE